ncbi:MAG TPA: Ku protein [Candidatus Binatia bacterium]|nr:Ku protein [Candidatus Binatia bacterium]
MAKRGQRTKTKSGKARASSRPIWKGSISFGLVSIPVALYAAEERQQLSFRMLDHHDFAPIRYERINAATGKPVAWDDIVKGYEYEKDEFVVLTDEDLRQASPEATQTIDLIHFVNASEINPIYYEKPYYIAPLKNGEKGYALLREVMRRTGRAAVAKFVLRSHEYLAAILVNGPVLVLNVLRFAHDLRAPGKLAVPEQDLRRLKITEKEIDMANQLVESMQDRWRPDDYREEYRDDVLKMIEEKIKSGKTKSIEEPARRSRSKQSGKVVDITELLKRSVENARKSEQTARRKAS